jgi:PAS domain S-box-containing protein
MKKQTETMLSKEIARRERAEDMMRRTREVLSSILEVQPLGVYIVNKKGGIDYVNSAMAIISGDTHEQFKSLNVFELPEYKKLGLDNMIRSVFEGSSFTLAAVEYTSHIGKKATIRDFIGIPYEEESEKKALIFVHDITEIKKAEEEMRKAMEMKSKFTSMVSHELRTPLSAIKGSIELVLNTTIGPLNSRQKELMDMIGKNVDRLSRLINDVLDYQKAETGKMVFVMKEDNINDVIVEVEKIMSIAAREKGIAMEVSLDKDLPPVNFSRDKITQVLTNIVNNAIKCTKKGKIAISTQRKDNTVLISVKDTGPGIRQEDMSRLFQPFEQIWSGKAKPEGTGLGLSISKEIVMRHKGKIWAESEPGKGTTFHFALPIKERT